MIPIDLPPKAGLWLPPKPAIIRAWKRDELSKANFLPGMFPAPFVPSSAVPASIVHTANVSATTDGPSYSGGVWDGIAIGSASATRRIIVALGHTINGRTISSLMIGGIGGNQVATATRASAVVYLWISDLITSGTTANFAVTFSGSTERLQTSFWAVHDLSSATPTDTASSIVVASPLNMDFAADGVGVACAYMDANTTFAWVGMTERYDNVADADTFSSADYSATGAETDRTITATAAAGTAQAGCAAAFR